MRRNLALSKINTLIAKGESENLEFKKSTGQLFSTFETLCAFLNGNGGTVIIGVTDNGKVLGQEVSDGTKQAIANEILKIEPHPRIDIKYTDIEKNKKIILLTVEKNHHIPYTYDGRSFCREQTVTKKMSQHRYEQLLIERGYLSHSWEEAVATGKTIDDLDADEIFRAVKQGIASGRIPPNAENENIENILKSWGLIHRKNINNAAVVLFAKEVLPHYPQCHIKLGRFRGTDMLGDIIDNRELFGNAFRIFEEANNFIVRHLPISSFFETDNLQRIDKPALPVLAVREALVNAICHRDYSNRSASITLAIFDDRMEIWNNGKLPASVRIDEIKKKHRSEPPNKIISKVFYDRKYFDGWGTGISKIFQLCKENDIPEPEYEEYSGGVEIKFLFKETISYSKTDKESIDTSLPEYSRISIPFSQRQIAILKIVSSGEEISLHDISEKLENAPALRTLRDDLNYLKKTHLINLRGRAKNARWFMAKGFSDIFREIKNIKAA